MNGARILPRAIAAVAVSAALLLSACASSASSSKYFAFGSSTKLGTLIPVNDRKPAHPFSGSLVSGGKTSLAKYRGKVTVVNFFGSWCNPCQVETPQLALLADKEKTVQFLGVDLADQMSSIKTFLTQSKVHYPVVFDEADRVPLTLDVPTKGVPFTVLIDKAGRVAAVYISPVTPKDLEGPLARLSKQS